MPLQQIAPGSRVSRVSYNRGKLRINEPKRVGTSKQPLETVAFPMVARPPETQPEALA